MKIPRTPPPLGGLLVGASIQQVVAVRTGIRGYPHWDDLVRREPPAGLTHEQWWAALKLPRLTGTRPIALRSVDGRPFVFTLPDAVLERLLVIDQQAAGRIAATDDVVNPATRDRYVISSLTEEAITSSQLEGASTTRRVARELLRTGRPPRTASERMIVNNYQAMQFVRERVPEPLTPDLVIEIQRVVTEDAANEADVGRIQQPGEERIRIEWDNGLVLHRPPPADELPERMRLMCEFANGGGEGFVHPVVRAVLLHFWLAYDHPLADGNGRTARALFYWSMLRQGYWLAEFLAISSILRKAPAKYARSFLLTETDDNDLTYFLLYQLEVIGRAIDELTAHVERKARETRSIERLVKSAGRLNHRQLALVSHAMRNADASYTVESHRRSHGVVYETARSDLLDLVGLGVLGQSKVGKAFRFSPAPDLENRLREV